MSITPTDDLIDRLKDPEYAKLYGEEDAKVDFAITLTKVRKSLGLKQKQMADKLGVSQPYIAKLEGGEANPTIGRIGSLLASIDLRLVTGTAPLKPDPMPSITGVILMGAPDAFEPRYDLPVNTGTMAGTIPPWPSKSEQRGAFIGGAAR